MLCLYETDLEYVQHNIELVFAELEVVTDFAETADRVESNGFDFVIKHVHEKVLRQFSECRRVRCKLTQRVHGCVTNLCIAYAQNKYASNGYD